MRTRISGALAILAALAACKKDPTADGVGTPDRVILDFATLTLTQGDSANVTAQVVDVRMTPLEQPITFTSCDGAAATVAIDPTFQPVPATRVRAKIRAVGGGAPLPACVLGTSGHSALQNRKLPDPSSAAHKEMRHFLKIRLRSLTTLRCHDIV